MSHVGSATRCSPTDVARRARSFEDERRSRQGFDGLQREELEVVVPVEPAALQRLDRQLGVFRSAQTLAGDLPHDVAVDV